MSTQTKLTYDNLMKWKSHRWGVFTCSNDCWRFSDDRDAFILAAEKDAKANILEKADGQRMILEVKALSLEVAEHCSGAKPKVYPTHYKIPGVNAWV